MVALGLNLYVIVANRLMATDFTMSSWVQIGNDSWNSVTSMTPLNSALYIVQGSALFKVLPTGANFLLGPVSNWPGDTTMAAIN